MLHRYVYKNRQCYGFPPFILSRIRFYYKQKSMSLKRPGRPTYITELAKDKIERDRDRANSETEII